MRKQVSHICQERAEGQRLLEKEQKMYEEEEEEEEEMTDGDTTGKKLQCTWISLVYRCLV